MSSAQKALENLREGNRRFVAGIGDREAKGQHEGQSARVMDQKPFAVILGCSDSRVPPERVFDQGFGDLFVVRVAGNVAGPSQIGSIEFAVEKFGTRLVVVLGHTRCGAVEATLEHLRTPGQPVSRNLVSIIDSIRPSVEHLLETPPAQDGDALSRTAIRSHIRASVDQLRRSSSVLGRFIAEDGLVVVGAEYSLESGVVDFFEEIPNGANSV